MYIYKITAIQIQCNYVKITIFSLTIFIIQIIIVNITDIYGNDMYQILVKANTFYKSMLVVDLKVSYL